MTAENGLVSLDVATLAPCIVLADLDRCKRIALSDWRRRGLWQRAKEQLASLIEDQV